MNWIIVISVLPLVVLVVVVVVVALLSRGKQLKCPECEHVFNAPVMEEKISGLGWTLPYMGRVKCPKCDNKRSRRDYNTVKH